MARHPLQTWFRLRASSASAGSRERTSDEARIHGDVFSLDRGARSCKAFLEETHVRSWWAGALDGQRERKLGCAIARVKDEHVARIRAQHNLLLAADHRSTCQAARSKMMSLALIDVEARRVVTAANVAELLSHFAMEYSLSSHTSKASRLR